MIGYRFDDGGRKAAGYKGQAGDCVARALAIFTGEDYRTIYNEVAKQEQRVSGKRSARDGVDKKSTAAAFAARGLVKAKLPKGPRPTYTEAYTRYGDCIVSTNRHVCAIVNGEVRDTFDERTYEWEEDGEIDIKERKARSVWVLPS